MESLLFYSVEETVSCEGYLHRRIVPFTASPRAYITDLGNMHWFCYSWFRNEFQLQQRRLKLNTRGEKYRYQTEALEYIVWEGDLGPATGSLPFFSSRQELSIERWFYLVTEEWTRWSSGDLDVQKHRRLRCVFKNHIPRVRESFL